MNVRAVRVALTIALLCFADAGELSAQRSPDTPPPSIINRVRIDRSKPIDFHAVVWPDTVYVNQQVNYQVGVFLSESARARLRRNPEFLPPELRGLIAYESSAPRRVDRVVVNGTTFEAHVFHRALFPVVSGDMMVPAPQLSYALPNSSSYFSRENSYVVRAESAHLVVRELPLVGRPADFTGAVGRYESRGAVNTDSLRVGDPIVFTLRVTGIGNIKLLPRPVLEVPWASVVAGSERLSIDSSGLLVRGAKEFDWILTPAVEGQVEMPAVRYSYFDPYDAQYDTALSAPLPLHVAPGSIVDTEERENAVLLPLRPSMEPAGLQWRASRLLNALSPTTWLLVLSLAPLPAIALFLRRRPEIANEREHVPVDDLAALALRARRPTAMHAPGETHDASHDARTVRRALHHALARRLGVRIQQLTDRRQVARLLRRRGATRATVSATLQLLERLDHAGFAVDAPTVGDSYAGAAAELFAVIEKETLPPGVRSSARGRQASAMLALSWQLFEPQAAPVSDTAAPAPALSLAPASTRGADRALLADFEAARQAYAQRRFVEATSRFELLATRAPDDVDVLANWGTAAWAQGDTVSAVIAWQRAARRDRLATDLQERLLLLPPGARGGVAEFSVLAPQVLWVVAGAAWVLGWLVLALGLHRARVVAGSDGETALPESLRVAAWTFIVFAGAAGAGAWYEERVHDARALHVVVRPETMRTQRGSDSDALGGVGTGDIVKHVGADGDWMQVQHADGRSGWLPMSRLVPLDPPRTSN